MMKHADVWRAIDSLAERNGLSPSGLARKAGLDPTTFNKSKRQTPAGKQRWPSTESIAKVLTATQSTLAEFVELVGAENSEQLATRLPVISLTSAQEPPYFDGNGHPNKEHWDEILFGHLDDENAYGLEISGSLLEPIYRDGDVLVVSPRAQIRRGDRVIAKTARGAILVKRLLRKSTLKVEFKGLVKEHGDLTLSSDEIAWIARILWASQ